MSHPALSAWTFSTPPSHADPSLHFVSLQTESSLQEVLGPRDGGHVKTIFTSSGLTERPLW